jgi:hypothetical protein
MFLGWKIMENFITFACDTSEEENQFSHYQNGERILPEKKNIGGNLSFSEALNG